MSGFNNFQEDHYQDRFQAGVLGFFDRMISGVNSKNKNSIIIGLVAVVAVVYFAVSQASASGTSSAEHEALGKAIALGQQGKVKEQAAELDLITANTSFQATTQMKALLLRADIHYKQGEYSQALDVYTKAQKVGVNHPIMSAAADNGVSTSLIQLKKYPEAKAALESYVAKYAKRPTDKSARLANNSAEDAIPFVPAALFKLALVNVELKDTAAAKEQCERILKVYPESNEARFALQLRETL